MYYFRFNAFAINGPEDDRIYKALYSNPAGKQADFHALHTFLPYDGSFINNLYSEFWGNALQNPVEK